MNIDNIYEYLYYFKGYFKNKMEVKKLFKVFGVKKLGYHPLCLIHIKLRNNYAKLYDKNLIYMIKKYYTFC